MDGCSYYQGESIHFKTVNCMLKSMTAYGRAKISSKLGTLAVEIHSVNRKHLEIQTNLPRELLPFDQEIKKWISEKVSRGQINLRLTASFDESGSQKLKLNTPLAQQLQGLCHSLKDVVKDAEGKVGLEFFLNFPGMIVVDEETIDSVLCRAALQELIHSAMLNLNAMKQAEGDVLQNELLGRFQFLQNAIKEIALNTSQATEKYRTKLKEKLEEVLPGCLENEDRILREICVYADKVDITEEIVRFQSHLEQSEQLIRAPNDRIGKNLEFLLQELHREMNTIGSKTGDVHVSHVVINCKTELERIREQLQNVE